MNPDLFGLCGFGPELRYSVAPKVSSGLHVSWACQIDDINMPTRSAGKRYLDRESLQCLAMLRNIEALKLLLERNPQGCKHADQLEQHEGYGARPQQGDADAIELDQHLLRVALDQAGSPADRSHREHAGQQCPGHAADAMHAEDVERIVIAQAGLYRGAGPDTEQARHHADAEAV